MTDRITVTISDGVADVRLSRPDKMNALDPETFDALVETGERLKGETAVRAVVLSGEGRAFCAGIDISLMGSGGKAFDLMPATRYPNGANGPQQAAMVWSELPMPVIAAVHGVAFGGGLQIALGADIRLVHPDTKFAFMEMRWGIIPDMGGFALGRRVVRDDQLRELIYTGRVVDGREALAMGIATRLTDDPRSEALAMAAVIAGQSPSAIGAAKRVLDLPLHASDADVLMAESVEQVKLMGGADQKDAMRRTQAMLSTRG